MNSQKTPNNPAGRLLRFLEKAKQLSVPANARIGDQLLRLFPSAVDGSDLATFLTEMTQVLFLVNETKRLLKLCDPEQFEIFQESGANLRGLVQIAPLHQLWTDYSARYLRADDIKAVKFADVIIGRFYPENVVLGDEIDRLRKEFEELIVSVSAASIPVDLKSLAIECLSDLSTSLANYELTGTKGVDEAIASVLGRAALNHGLRFMGPEEKEDYPNVTYDDAGGWRFRLWNLVGKVSEATGAKRRVDSFLAAAGQSGKSMEDPFMRLLDAKVKND